jgi:hypothetical protein
MRLGLLRPPRLMPSLLDAGQAKIRRAISGPLTPVTRGLSRSLRGSPSRMSGGIAARRAQIPKLIVRARFPSPLQPQKPRSDDSADSGSASAKCRTGAGGPLARAARMNRSPALLRAGCRPRAEQHVRSAYQRVAPFRFIPQPLLKRLHADLLGGGHSGAHDQRLGDMHGFH